MGLDSGRGVWGGSCLGFCQRGGEGKLHQHGHKGGFRTQWGLVSDRGIRDQNQSGSPRAPIQPHSPAGGLWGGALTCPRGAGRGLWLAGEILVPSPARTQSRPRRGKGGQGVGQQLPAIPLAGPGRSPQPNPPLRPPFAQPSALPPSIGAGKEPTDTGCRQKRGMACPRGTQESRLPAPPALTPNPPCPPRARERTWEWGLGSRTGGWRCLALDVGRSLLSGEWRRATLLGPCVAP